MQTNVLGSFYMIHAAVDGLLSQGSGDIVNISSVAGRTAKTGSGIYNAASGPSTPSLSPCVRRSPPRVCASC